MMSSFNLKHSQGPKLKFDFHGFEYPWPTVQFTMYIKHLPLNLKVDLLDQLISLNFTGLWG